MVTCFEVRDFERNIDDRELRFIYDYSDCLILYDELDKCRGNPVNFPFINFIWKVRVTFLYLVWAQIF